MWGLFEEVDAGYEYILCLVSIHATKEDAIAASGLDASYFDESYEQYGDYYIVELKAGQTFIDIEKECGFFYIK